MLPVCSYYAGSPADKAVNKYNNSHGQLISIVSIQLPLCTLASMNVECIVGEWALVQNFIRLCQHWNSTIETLAIQTTRWAHFSHQLILGGKNCRFTKLKFNWVATYESQPTPSGPYKVAGSTRKWEFSAITVMIPPSLFPFVSFPWMEECKDFVVGLASRSTLLTYLFITLGTRHGMHVSLCIRNEYTITTHHTPHTHTVCWTTSPPHSF